MLLKITFLGVLLAATACSTIPSRSTASDGIASIKTRVSSRSRPSIFSAWNNATDLHSGAGPAKVALGSLEDPMTTANRHDLLWRTPEAMGLRHNAQKTFAATGFTPESIEAAHKLRARLMELNPNAILLVSISYRAAPDFYADPDASFWRRDASGARVVAWHEQNYTAYKLDFSKPEIQKRTVDECRWIMEAGVADGCFLDWWVENDTPLDFPGAGASRLALLKTLRDAVGDAPLILVNTNGRLPEKSAPYINGMYMEGFYADFFNKWETARDNLIWATKNLRAPALTAFEGWYALDDNKGRDDFARLRMTTTMSLVFADGYALFGDPNALPTPDHLHDWYPFWNTKLGKPTEAFVHNYDGTYVRQFENGAAVFNPPDNAPVTMNFAVKVFSGASQSFVQHFVIAPGDGDIILDRGN